MKFLIRLNLLVLLVAFAVLATNCAAKHKDPMPYRRVGFIYLEPQCE